MERGAGRTDEAPGAWGEDDSRVYVEFGRAMVPGREEVERTFLELIPAEPDEPLFVVDIGIGAGWLSVAVLREFPEARSLGLDGSPEMLRAAAEGWTFGGRVPERALGAFSREASRDGLTQT